MSADCGSTRRRAPQFGGAGLVSTSSSGAAVVAVSCAVAIRFALFETFGAWIRPNEATTWTSSRCPRSSRSWCSAASAGGATSTLAPRPVCLAATEQELAEANERYRSLYDYHPDSVFTLDTHGRLVAMNAAAVAMSGYTPEEMATLDIPDYVEPHDIERVTGTFRALLARPHRAARDPDRAQGRLPGRRRGDRPAGHGRRGPGRCLRHRRGHHRAEPDAVRAGGGPPGGRGRQRGEVAVPRQHEPRDPDAAHQRAGGRRDARRTP